jgi:hypothetical protein
VRPGWFDYNTTDEQQLVMLQGDTRQAGDPSDGAVARNQIAEVLVHSLDSEAAKYKTFELVAERGPKTADFDAHFSRLLRDDPRMVDGVLDMSNMPVEQEPEQVLKELDSASSQRSHDRT